MKEKYLIFTVILLITSLSFLSYKYINTGFFIDKGVELKGGYLITLSFSDNTNIEDIKKNIGDRCIIHTISSAIGTQVSLECSDINTTKLIREINLTNPISNYEVSKIDPKITAEILNDISSGILFAFIAMSIIIFILFRKLVPSFAVVLCAFSDIVITLFFMNLLDIKLTLATFTGLLMLIGYSVDTDILLTTRILKDRKNFDRQYKTALKTGLTMSATSTVALLSLLIITGYNSVFGQLASVLIIGLLVDIPNTWIQNASILKIYYAKNI
ncbi:MAG: hypothetical protein B6U88_00120 [Candidatus Aenigmarchaeota archaeon ex4484_56]|nr:MAG: hypothetical protein B6U88_00120 [Candidatus Aenigmarchaeota archaeon ex4484_56]